MGTYIFNKATLCGALLFCTISFTHADAYYIQDLGTLGGHSSAAYALNNLGQVVGYADTNVSPSATVHAVLFSGTGSNNIDLDVLGGNTTIGEATGINDSGQIVGDGQPAAGGRVEALLYKASGTVPLDDLCDNDVSSGTATAINNSGTIVGWASDCFFTVEPCRFGGNGSGNVALAGIDGGTSGLVFGINASGQGAGYGDRKSDGARHAVFFSASGSSVDLGTLGGFNSLAYGLNDAGQVVGDSALPGNSVFHAALFGTNGSNNIDLGSLGGISAHAYAINNSGEIVGNSYPATNNNSVYHAFIYKNGVMTDINGLLLPNSGFHNVRLLYNGGSTPGRCINESGQIAAMGETNGLTHAILLTPVLRKVGAQRSGNNIIVTFDAVAGKTYRLEYSVNLTTWQSVPGVADDTALTTGPAQFTQTNGATLAKAYYRVRLL